MLTLEKLAQRVGARFRSWRRMKDMAQQDVADLIGLTVSRVCEVETGTRTLTTDMLVRISNATSIPIEDYVREDPTPDPGLDTGMLLYAMQLHHDGMSKCLSRLYDQHVKGDVNG